MAWRDQSPRQRSSAALSKLDNEQRLVNSITSFSTGAGSKQVIPQALVIIMTPDIAGSRVAWPLNLPKTRLTKRMGWHWLALTKNLAYYQNKPLPN